MFVCRDPWTALPGNTSQTPQEHHPLVYDAQLGGVPLCDSHFLALQSWYWAQAVVLAQAQRNMAEDQWMPAPEAVEVSPSSLPSASRQWRGGLCRLLYPDGGPGRTTLYVSRSVLSHLNWPHPPKPDEFSLLTGAKVHDSYLGLQDRQIDSQFPNAPSLPAQSSSQAHYDYIQPLFDNGFWSRAPYAVETQPLTSPRPPPAPAHAGASGSPQAYPLSWDQTQDLAGACYRMGLDDPEIKREGLSVSPLSSRPCCDNQWATASPGDLRFAPSLSPDPAASSPPLSPDNDDDDDAAAAGGSPDTPATHRKPAGDSRGASPPAATPRRRTRASTPDPPKPRPAPDSGSADRAAMDEFLVRSRLEGKSYREIRRLGGFTEAESTLRGRFRALTKRKEERVRRPEWSDIDVSPTSSPPLPFRTLPI